MTASPLRLPDPDEQSNIPQPKPPKETPTEQAAEIIIEATALEAEVVELQSSPSNLQPVPEQVASAPSNGALATRRGSFSSFLAPLKQDTFKEVVTEVEKKLTVVNQTLSMLDMQQGFEVILEEMLTSITFKTAELLNADRTSIFLLDDEKNELYSIVAGGEGGKTLEIRIPADQGIAGEVATTKQVVNIPYDLFDDPRSAQAKIQYERSGYRTYTMLAMPLLNEEGDLVAVVQMINKLKPDAEPSQPLSDRITKAGFSADDEQLFREFAPSIRLILESSRSFYVATQKQRAANALISATQSLSKSSLDLEETLKKVMDEAKELMNADRSTLWLLDTERGDLWTRIPNKQGILEEKRIPRDAGFAGQVATSGEPLLIPFDLYDHPNAETAKEFDRQTGYRTCSMLCMPVFNADGELIGVTQLVNKKRQGEFPPYNPDNFPNAPECWRASFNRSDQEFMKAFNIQAGVALQNAKLFATVKQQEKLQRDILRSLSNGVISTDNQGQVIAANESAKRLLGLEDEVILAGQAVGTLIRLEKSDFSRWLQAALTGTDEKSQRQYYPDQTLLPVRGEEQHSINLSLNTIQDAVVPEKISGALIVMDDVSDEKRLKSTMYRYMTQELAEQLLENPDAAKMGGDRKEVSVLFSDIRSYTTLTESLRAEEVVDLLNQYFEAMVDAVFTYKGTLDKYIGDAIMAVFGSPLPLDNHEWMSVQTALEMRQRLKLFNARRIDQGLVPISIGIGIHSDTVISGNIGSSRRMEFTAIGDGVNLSSRLEGATKFYGTDIVISESTYQACTDRIWVRELDYIRVKGRNQPVAVYELIGMKTDPVPDLKQQVIEHYHKGREYYLNRKFALAMGEFATALEVDKTDKSSSLHLERCQHWLQSPPPEDWDGSWTFTEK